MTLLLVVAAGVLGLAIGAASHSTAAVSADPTEAPAYVTLLSRFNTTVAERDRLVDAARTAATRQDESAAAQERLSAQQEQLDARQAHLDRLAAKLDRRQTKVAVAEAAAAEEVSGTTASSGDGAAASVYYQNCDAARAAGAAPVHRGDPGYAGHLDRDGDGVGCE